MPAQVNEREERWEKEAAFFDQWMEKIDVQPIDPLTLDRYMLPVRRRFNKEFRFHLLGDLRGKTVLDVGCGDGTNAVTLARLGAEVTGIDISPKSIEIAEKRARANGCSNLHFICAPLETANLKPASFDVVWGDMILHHLIPELDEFLPKVVECVKPGGLVLFAEPINFNQTLRRLRFIVPIHTEHTEDERPLEATEIAVIRKSIPNLRVRPFALFGRLDRFIITKYNYERSSGWRKRLSDAIALVDYGLLSMPLIRNLGGTAVLYGQR